MSVSLFVWLDSSVYFISGQACAPFSVVCRPGSGQGACAAPGHASKSNLVMAPSPVSSPLTSTALRSITQPQQRSTEQHAPVYSNQLSTAAAAEAMESSSNGAVSGGTDYVPSHRL